MSNAENKNKMQYRKHHFLPCDFLSNPFNHQLSSESGGDTADDQTQELTEEEKEKYRQKRK
jgi:hypothetical protein